MRRQDRPKRTRPQKAHGGAPPWYADAVLVAEGLADARPVQDT